MRTVVLGTVLSLAVLAIAGGAASLGMDPGEPHAFWWMAVVSFASLAVWNIATIRRTSSTPQGTWLAIVVTPMFIAGVLGVLMSRMGLGIIFIVCALLFVALRTSRNESHT